MEKSINRSIRLVCFSVAILCGIIIFVALQVQITGLMQRSVKESAQNMAEVFNGADIDAEAVEIQNQNSLRLTWIAANGDILYDTADATENHGDRPEIISALDTGYGEATRLSDTLRKETYYYAIKLDDNSVLRMATTTDSIIARLIGALPLVILALLGVIVVVSIVSRKLTKKIVEPINNIDIENPLNNNVYDEVVPLLRRIHKQNNELSQQLEEVKKVKNDLSAIMENMAEGLIVFDHEGKIISINSSGKRILDRANEETLGKTLLEIKREDEFVKVAQSIIEEKNCHIKFSNEGRVYSGALSQASQGGSILMMIDVTEKCQSEQMRREFSANVSHELKTPLQSILGYAELLKNKIVKEEDKDDFYNNIHKECQRLIALVQDIIDLSRLDEEGDKLEKEDVSVTEIAKEVVGDLQVKAQAKEIKLQVKGEDFIMSAIPSLVREMIFNLVDNAINYNKIKGSVQITTKSDEYSNVIMVEDTGIGIPKEHRERIFERFYRVDKSHSRQTGGTGLGLSIVKHAVQYHGGSIKVLSHEDKGTTIVVELPKDM